MVPVDLVICIRSLAEVWWGDSDNAPEYQRLTGKQIGSKYGFVSQMVCFRARKR